MTAPAPEPNRGLVYAEQQLGVHKVYEETRARADWLRTCLDALVDARTQRRHVERFIADREVELAEEEWMKHPEMAVTRMEKHLKTALVKDAALRSLRETHDELSGAIDELEASRSLAEKDIQIGTARITELGGYFHYLSALKQGETLTKLVTHEKPGDNA